jgi:hypothetical protein
MTKKKEKKKKEREKRVAKEKLAAAAKKRAQAKIDGTDKEPQEKKKVFSVVPNAKIDFVPTTKKTFTQRRTGGG